jgi:hypothetical protein
VLSLVSRTNVHCVTITTRQHGYLYNTQGPTAASASSSRSIRSFWHTHFVPSPCPLCSISRTAPFSPNYGATRHCIKNYSTNTSRPICRHCDALLTVREGHTPATPTSQHGSRLCGPIQLGLDPNILIRVKHSHYTHLPRSPNIANPFTDKVTSQVSYHEYLPLLPQHPFLCL